MINSFYHGTPETCRAIKNRERRLAKRKREQERGVKIKKVRESLTKWGTPFYQKELRVTEWVFYPWYEKCRNGIWINPRTHEQMYGEKNEQPLGLKYYVWISKVPQGDVPYKIPMKTRENQHIEGKASKH